MLDISHVYKSFNIGTPVQKDALIDLSLHLNEGDFVTVIGGNGAGKSTMLNAVAGVFGVEGGQIKIAGNDVTKDPEFKRAKYIGRVFQDPLRGTASDMWIEENLALTLLMATMKKPELLLLDEHTAALDPKTAKKVLDITNKVVTENHLTTLMITHNMKDAIKYGNRLIMMNDGNIIYDVSGEEKKNLQVSDLLLKFEQASDGEFANDRMMLSR